MLSLMLLYWCVVEFDVVYAVVVCCVVGVADVVVVVYGFDICVFVEYDDVHCVVALSMKVLLLVLPLPVMLLSMVLLFRIVVLILSLLLI